MKKTTTLLILILLFVSPSFTQVIIDEDFQNITFPPSGWISLDEDGLGSTNQYTGNWERKSILFSGDTLITAFCGSSYSPSGRSDDWLITPSIIVPNDSTKATFISFYNNSFLGGGNVNNAELELKVSTTGTNVADFTSTFPLVLGATSSTFQLNAVDLSQFAGDTIYVAIRNRSRDILAVVVDDILVETIEKNAVSLKSLTIPNLVPKRQAIDISGVILNKGATIIDSVDISWSADGGKVHKATISGLNIGPYSTGSFIHPFQFTGFKAANQTIAVKVSNPNGLIDPDSTDNELSKTVLVNHGIILPKNVLFEQFTTVPTGFSPDGHLITDKIIDSLPGVIPVHIHACFGSDAMTNMEATELCNQFSSFVPSATVDRVLFGGESEVAFGRSTLTNGGESAWLERSITQTNKGSAVRISIAGTYDSLTRVIDLDVVSSFADYALDGDIRLSLLIIEDSVSGSGSGYDQRNFYNNLSNNFTHPFYGAGDPLVGYEHRHVLRDILPSTWGDSSVIPNKNILLNTAYNKNFNFTLNSSWDETQVSVVAVLSYYGGQDIERYEVINAEKVRLKNLDSLGNKGYCQASYSITEDTSTSFGVLLINTSTNSSSHTYLWDFGDSTTASARTPSHSYQSFGTYEVCLTISDTILNCSSTFCDTVGMDSLGNLKTGFAIQVIDQSQLVTGIENKELEGAIGNELVFNIYPNPAKDQINIDLRGISETVNIRFIDISGREVLNWNGISAGKIETLDVSTFTQGLYFIIVNNEQGQKAKRIVIAD